MHNVTSRDGTTIAFDRLGDGPPVVLVWSSSQAEAGPIAGAVAGTGVPPRRIDMPLSGGRAITRSRSTPSTRQATVSAARGQPARR